MASRLSVRGPSSTLIPGQRALSEILYYYCLVTVPLSKLLPVGHPALNQNLVYTCHLAAIGNPNGTEAVVGNRCNLAGTPCPMVVVTAGVWVRHGVWVIGVQVITAFWTLEGKHKKQFKNSDFKVAVMKQSDATTLNWLLLAFDLTGFSKPFILMQCFQCANCLFFAFSTTSSGSKFYRWCLKATHHRMKLPLVKTYIIGPDVFECVFHAIIYHHHRDSSTSDVPFPQACYIDVHALVDVIVLQPQKEEIKVNK